MSMNRTRVYVDGFNLYYGAFREGPFGPYKWLNLAGFCQDILSRGSTIDLIRYFTARVKPTPTDPTAANARRGHDHRGKGFRRQPGNLSAP